MVITTRPQREAIKRVYDRAPIISYHHTHTVKSQYAETTAQIETRLSYRGFRARIMPTFGCDGAVTVEWMGMWLCIERDGYVHS